MTDMKIITDSKLDCDVIFFNNTNFSLESGVKLENFKIAYKTFGELNSTKTNAILVCHALTGDQYLTGNNPITGKDGSGVFYDITESITVTDGDNNSATTTRTIRFVDTLGPNIAIPGSDSQPIEFIWNDISNETNLSDALNIDISDQTFGTFAQGNIHVVFTNDVSLASIENNLPCGRLFTVTASDGNNNSSSASVQVFITSD